MTAAGLTPHENDATYVNKMEPPYLERKGIFKIFREMFGRKEPYNTGCPETSHQSQYS